MFHPNFVSAAAGAFPFCGIPAAMESLAPRSPFQREGAFFYPPSSPSCSSGGIPSPRLVSPSVTQRKSSFTIEAILGLKDSKDDDVFRTASSSPDPPVKGWYPCSGVRRLFTRASLASK